MIQKESNKNYLQIDIEKVFASKSEKLAKLLPGFILRYLKRIIHQDELNDFLSRSYMKQGVDFADSVLEELDIKFKVEGLENIEKDKRYIFASNHPLGGPDGIILISIFGKHFPKIKFLVNDILMNIKNLSEVFLPINKHGGQAKEAALMLENAYASDATILTFPAGLVSRKQKGIIKDLQWKKSFIVKSKKYKRDIVPIHIDGENSNFFYNLANFRKLIGLKANIEMLYLPDELFKQKGKTFTVKIGKPISYKTFDKRLNHSQWADKMKEETYKLVNQ
jgi:putative hemolysin